MSQGLLCSGSHALAVAPSGSTDSTATVAATTVALSFTSYLLEVADAEFHRYAGVEVGGALLKVGQSFCFARHFVLGSAGCRRRGCTDEDRTTDDGCGKHHP